jgi:hypothetical protein
MVIRIHSKITTVKWTHELGFVKKKLIQLLMMKLLFYKKKGLG